MKRPSRSYSPVSCISAALNANIVDHELVAGNEVGKVETERRDVSASAHFRRLLERHKNACVIELRGAPNEKLGSKQGLAASRRAAKQRGTSSRQASESKIVKAGDFSWGFLQMNRRIRRRDENFTIWHSMTFWDFVGW